MLHSGDRGRVRNGKNAWIRRQEIENEKKPKERKEDLTRKTDMSFVANNMKKKDKPTSQRINP